MIHGFQWFFLLQGKGRFSPDLSTWRPFLTWTSMFAKPHPFVSVPWQGPNIPAGGPTAPSKSPNLLPPPNFQVQGKGGTLKSRFAKGRGGNKALADWRVGRKAVVGLIVGRAHFFIGQPKNLHYMVDDGEWGLPWFWYLDGPNWSEDFCVNFVMVRLTSKQLTLHLQGLDCSKLQGQCQSCEIEKWIRQLYCRVVKQINRIPTIVPEKCRKDGRHLALLCEMTRGRNLSMINRNDSQSCFSFQDPPGGWPGSGTSAWILTNKCPWNLSILPKFCFFLTWNVVLHLPALGGSDGTELLWKF